MSYQWVFNETNFLAGATNAMLTLSNVTSAQAGLYAAVVSHANGAITSQSAILRVLELAAKTQAIRILRAATPRPPVHGYSD